MELYRDIYKKLITWRNESDKILLLLGCRQIGKTTVVRNFGKKNFESFIEINFILRPELKEIFNDELTYEVIISKIQKKFPDSKIIPNETLILLDEIQMCDGAISALRFIRNREVKFIATGSVISFQLQEKTFTPMGDTEQITMLPLTFYEFLVNVGYTEQMIVDVKIKCSFNKKIDNFTIDLFQKWFRTYIAVGGMPTAVIEYVKSKDFNKIFQIHCFLLNEIKLGMTKKNNLITHDKEHVLNKALDCYESIPYQLNRNNKNFKWSLVKKNSKKDREIIGLHWLEKTCLVNIARAKTNSLWPLMSNNENDNFKVYLNDTGLLIAMYQNIGLYRAIIDNELSILNGGIYENAIANILVSKGKHLYYLERNLSDKEIIKISSTKQFANTPIKRLEIDFLIEEGLKIKVLEVKSGKHSSRSLNVWRFLHPNLEFIKLIDGNLAIDGNLKVLPLFCCLFL